MEVKECGSVGLGLAARLVPLGWFAPSFFSCLSFLLGKDGALGGFVLDFPCKEVVTQLLPWPSQEETQVP